MARLISTPGCHTWLGECDDSTGPSAAGASATGRWGDRLAHRPGGTGHLRYPEPDAYQDRLPVLEFYLAIVALHHRDRAIRGIGMVRAGRDASPQTPQGTPRKPAGLTRWRTLIPVKCRCWQGSRPTGVLMKSTPVSMHQARSSMLTFSMVLVIVVP